VESRKLLCLSYFADRVFRMVCKHTKFTTSHCCNKYTSNMAAAFIVVGRMTSLSPRVLVSILIFHMLEISVAVQRFNSVLMHDGFIDDDRPESGALPNNFTSFDNF